MSDALLKAVEAGTRIFDLAQPLHPAIPHSPNHPGFRFALMRRHGDVVRGDGTSSASELLVTGGHVGTHVDALAHLSVDGRMGDGREAATLESNLGYREMGIDQMRPVVGRGVLLDVCAVHGVSRLPAAHPISADELRAAAARSGVELRPGDSVLVRTGWAQLWSEPAAFLGQATGVPGPDAGAAAWLAEHRIRLTGSDTTAYEHVGAPREDALPVHRLLLHEHGIHIVEMLDLEDLAAAGCSEFVFVLLPLAIVGGTGSPVRPVALVTA